MFKFYVRPLFGSRHPTSQRNGPEPQKGGKPTAAHEPHIDPYFNVF